MSLTVEKCLQAWYNSLSQMKASADIVFFGDSLTYYGNFASVIPDKVVCNLGLRGDTLKGLLNRVKLVKMLKPSSVFLMAGINDVVSLPVKEFGLLYKELLYELKGASVFVQSILPVNTQYFTVSCNNCQIKSCNIIIERLAKEYAFAYIDLYSRYEENGQLSPLMTKDGIHLTESAYSKWYMAINEYV